VKRAVFVTLAGLLLSFSYVAVSASAGTPDYLKVNYPAIASFEPYTEPPSPTPVPTAPPDSCWDCYDSTYTWAEARVWYCSEERVRENPLIVDECWPDKWEWVCFPDGHCEMYRQDLDPLGIFATPPPMPTPEPLPTPVPTATPDPTPEPTPEPEPETPATATP
jgi:hypothetical protein